MTEDGDTTCSEASSTALVSVIVPTHDRPWLLRRALESVAAQTYANIEVVLVRDAPGDGADPLGWTHELGLSQLVAVQREPESSDHGSGRNAGLARARGDYVCFLDDDDLLHPDHVQRLAAALDDGADVAFSHAYERRERWTGERFELTERVVVHDATEVALEDLLVSNLVPILTVMHRRELAANIGGFDPNLAVLEDWDYWIRLRAACSFVHVPHVTCEYSVRESGPQRVTTRRGAQFPISIARIYDRYRAQAAHYPGVAVRQEQYLRIAERRWGTPSAPGARIELSEQPMHDAATTPSGMPFTIPAVACSDNSAGGDELVSIVILTLNELAYTRRCVESIRAHTPVPYELIFVDNGSTDGTVDYLRTLENANVIANDENVGFGGGCNMGMAAARGDWLVLLNNDTVVTAGWLEEMLDVAREHPTVGIIGPRSNYVKGAQLLRADYDQVSLAGLDEFAAAIRDPADAGASARASYTADGIVGLCMLIRRNVLRTIGGFDLRYGVGHFEDDDFCVRARLSGWHIRIALRSFVHHFGSRTFSQRGNLQSASDAAQAEFVERWKLQGIPRHNVGASLAFLAADVYEPCALFRPLANGMHIAVTAASEGAMRLYVALDDEPSVVRARSQLLRECLVSYGPDDDVSIIVRAASELAANDAVIDAAVQGIDDSLLPDVVIIDTGPESDEALIKCATHIAVAGGLNGEVLAGFAIAAGKPIVTYESLPDALLAPGRTAA